jgi:hypothetical protein
MIHRMERTTVTWERLAQSLIRHMQGRAVTTTWKTQELLPATTVTLERLAMVIIHRMKRTTTVTLGTLVM